MPYITNADIERRVGPAAYVQLTDDAGTGQANEAVADEARDSAEGELNAYLARRFAVPIDLIRHAELRGVLVGVALDLAEYRLRLRRPPAPAESTARRAAAIAWLQRVAGGEIDLPAATPLAAPAVDPLPAKAVGHERVLTREELAGY